MSLILEPADQYSVEQLTEIYNQTRVDYLVPMPMSPEVLAEYIHDFDINLNNSLVARDASGQILGLGMLGFRDGTGWLTRLGVMPDLRRHGTGQTIVDGLMENARRLECKKMILEVIKNNTPARTLFHKYGFKETDEYLVFRRAPIPPTIEPEGKLTWLFRKDALVNIKKYPQHLTWVNAYESMANGSNLQGFHIQLPGGDSGWIIYRHKRFSLMHLVLHTETGNPALVARNLLIHLHRQYRRQDTYAENFRVNDPHLPGLFELGYFEAFRRVEMILEM